MSRAGQQRRLRGTRERCRNMLMRFDVRRFDVLIFVMYNIFWINFWHLCSHISCSSLKFCACQWTRQRRMSNLKLPDQPKSSVSGVPVSPSPSVTPGAPSEPAEPDVDIGSLRPDESLLPGEVGVHTEPSAPSPTPKMSTLEPPPIGTPGPPGEHSQSVLLTPVPTSPQNSNSQVPQTTPSRRSSLGNKISLQSPESNEAQSRWQYIKEEAVPTCRQINRSKAFLLIMFVALLFALFFPDLWILVDRSTNVDLDVLLTLVFLMFVFEFVVQCIAGRHTYVGSFFFYMDILGGVSLLLDVNYIGIQALIQSAGDVGNQAPGGKNRIWRTLKKVRWSIGGNRQTNLNKHAIVYIYINILF